MRNKSLNLGVTFRRQGATERGFGVVQVPSMLRRLLPVNGVKTSNGQPAARAYVLLEDLVARHVSTIFPGVELDRLYVFRVTRNFDIEIDEEEAEDLLQSIQQELRRRERGNAVRLEVAGDPPAGSLEKLAKAFRLDPERDVYHVEGMLNLADLMSITRYDARGLREEPFAAHPAPPLRDADDIFAAIREGDVLLHHPYESFDSVVDLIARAADDPDVLAIKQTLYRAGGDSPIVKALARAAESGKQVTAIVELKDASTKSRTSSGRACSSSPGPTLSTVFSASRPTPSAFSSCGVRKASFAAIAIYRPATTTPRPRASIPTSLFSPRDPICAKTCPAFSIC